MTPARGKIYQIKVSLNSVKPPIWRRLLVASSTELSDLHEIIQIAMGWSDSHLHEFVAGPRSFGVPDPDFEDDMIDETGIPLDSVLKKEKQWIGYEYDFGDGWEHRITLEKILPAEPGQELPQCTAGRRACPPEDVGGPWGYAEFLKAYTDAAHPEHEELVDWAGEYFDPEYFDTDEVNQVIKSDE